jgi:flagellar export protein FliJ
MMRYRFRLQQVLRVRTIERDRAVGDVAQARAELARAEHRTAEARRLYESMPAPDGSDVRELQSQMRVRSLLVDAIAAALAAEAQQHLVLDECLVVWTEADKKVRLLEELDERSRQRHEAMALAAEQQELDDLVTSRRAGAGAGAAS